MDLVWNCTNYDRIVKHKLLSTIFFFAKKKKYTSTARDFPSLIHSSRLDWILLPRSPAPGTAAAARSRSPSPTRNNNSSANGSQTQSVKTKLQLVDLAGSECVGKMREEAGLEIFSLYLLNHKKTNTSTRRYCVLFVYNSVMFQFTFASGMSGVTGAALRETSHINKR